ncbi:MAG: hypothetical protein IT335_04240 [Thermomicrobiales bacterium]|nr:hypothetical protein [Thermomicrobiales bacterium]
MALVTYGDKRRGVSETELQAAWDEAMAALDRVVMRNETLWKQCRWLCRYEESGHEDWFENKAKHGKAAREWYDVMLAEWYEARAKFHWLILRAGERGRMWAEDIHPYAAQGVEGLCQIEVERTAHIGNWQDCCNTEPCPF